MNLTLNKRPEIFDMYTGEYEHGDGTKAVYNLLTYKSTSIIHNLFPKAKTFNKKKYVNLIRGDVTGELSIPTNIYEIRIPYLDHKGLKYTIILRDFLEKGSVLCLFQRLINPLVDLFTLRLRKRILMEFYQPPRI